MHRARNLIVLMSGCFTLVISCFLAWSHSPRYSLFTIADYAGGYGRYIDQARILAIAAFLVPIGACVTLISVPFRRVCRIMTVALGLYSLTFAISALFIVHGISTSFPTPSQTPGTYVCVLASSLLLGVGIFSRAQPTTIPAVQHKMRTP